MTIHHAIVKSAAAKGVILTSDEDQVTARDAASNEVATVNIEDHDSENDAAREAWDIVTNIVVWNAEDGAKDGMAIWQDPEDLTFALMLRTITEAGPSDEPVETGFETWADAIEAAQAVETGEAEADEDEDDHGSVVPAGFKALYKEIGIRKQDNGDFLAAICADHCVILDGKREVIDCEKVEALASRNGVEYPLDSYAGFVQQTRGWEGRYRMTVGNMLRKRVADAGECTIPASLNNGTEKVMPAPEAFCDKYRTKPKTKAAKKEAAQAAADIAAPEAE